MLCGPSANKSVQFAIGGKKKKKEKGIHVSCILTMPMIYKLKKSFNYLNISPIIIPITHYVFIRKKENNNNNISVIIFLQSDKCNHSLSEVEPINTN